MYKSANIIQLINAHLCIMYDMIWHEVWFFLKFLGFWRFFKVFWNRPTPIFLVLYENDQILKPIFSVFFSKTTHPPGVSLCQKFVVLVPFGLGQETLIFGNYCFGVHSFAKISNLTLLLNWFKITILQTVGFNLKLTSWENEHNFHI
jgi:hypothetical protein